MNLLSRRQRKSSRCDWLYRQICPQMGAFVDSLALYRIFHLSRSCATGYSQGMRHHPSSAMRHLLAWCHGVPALLLSISMATFARGQLTEVDRDVDRLLQMLGVKQTQAEAIERFREMGDAATPRLIERFASPHQADRVLALIALQHAWSDQAIEPVKQMLNDRDAVVREAALRLLDQKLDDDQVVATFEPLLDSRDNRLRGLILQALEQRSPDADRMFQAARDRHLVQFVTPFLPRYYEPRFRQVVLPLLHQRPQMQRHAIIAITHLRDDSPATLRRITLLLRNQRADIRELAAEYLFHLGGEAELTPLREALDRERDDHARAAIALAIRAIERRRDMFANQGDANPLTRRTQPRPTGRH